MDKRTRLDITSRMERPINRAWYALGSSFLGRLGSLALERLAVTFALEGKRGDETLDLGGLGDGLLALLGGEFPSDDELANIVFLGKGL